jgi:hypothetical protein
MESDNDVDITDLEVEDIESDANSTASDDESKDEPEGNTRKKYHSLMPHGSFVSPTQLQFYPLQWTEVLECAKTKWRLCLLTK